MLPVIRAPTFFLCAVFVAGCSPEPVPPGTDSLVSTEPKASQTVELSGLIDTVRPISLTDSTNPSAPFSCSPSTLTRKDTLTLRIRVPHGGYLAATHPDGTDFFIVYPKLGEPAPDFSLIPTERFKEMSTIRLSTEVTGNLRVHPRDSLAERVFTQPGRYVLRVGETLGSDFGPEPLEYPVTFVTD